MQLREIDSSVLVSFLKHGDSSHLFCAEGFEFDGGCFTHTAANLLLDLVLCPAGEDAVGRRLKETQNPIRDESHVQMMVLFAADVSVVGMENSEPEVHTISNWQFDARAGVIASDHKHCMALLGVSFVGGKYRTDRCASGAVVLPRTSRRAASSTSNHIPCGRRPHDRPRFRRDGLGFHG